MDMGAVDAELSGDNQDREVILVSQSDDLCVIGVREFDVSSAPNVLKSSNWFEVLGSDTWVDLAEMVEFKSIWDGADLSFVHRSVGPDHFAVQFYKRVPFRVFRSLPNPARSEVSTILNDVVIDPSFGFGVVIDKGVRLPFDVTFCGSSSISDVGLLATSALTETVGDVTLGSHCNLLNCDAVPPVAATMRGISVESLP